MEGVKSIIESLLFVADAPIPMDRFKEVLEIDEAGEIREALDALAREYEERNGGIFLSEVAGGYQIRTRPEYHEYVKRLLKPGAQRLSNAALETLAIIAYKQPIIRSDIEHLRGVDCGGVLRVLMEKKLVRVLGRKEIPGRPLIYATTKHFLEVFELKNLKDLPSPKEIEKHVDAPRELISAGALFDSEQDPAQDSEDDPADTPPEEALPREEGPGPDAEGVAEQPADDLNIPPAEEKKLDLNDQTNIET